MTTSWLVLCAAGGHEREAARLVNQSNGTSYLPQYFPDGYSKPGKLLLPGYVLGRWLDDEPPFAKLYEPKSRRGNRLIWAIKIAANGNTGILSQRDVDIMEAAATLKSVKSDNERYKIGQTVSQKLGMTGAEVLWRVKAIAGEIVTLRTVMLGKVIEKKVKVAA